MRNALAILVATAVLLGSASCAGDAPVATSAEGCGAGFRQVFSSAASDGAERGLLYTVYAAVSLPGVSLVVLYNPNNPGAGDEPKTTPDRLVEVSGDGTLTRLELPVLDGARVGDSVVPLVAAPDGTLYLYDGAAHRVVSMDLKQNWSVVAELSEVPLATVGPDGQLYLATVSSVLRVEADGALTRIAGTATLGSQDIQGPQPPLVGLPLPATQVNLSRPTGITVAPDGSIFLAMGSLILRLSGGPLTEAVNSRTLTGVVPGYSGPSDVIFRGLVVDGDGSLITVATGETIQVQRIVDLSTAETIQAGPTIVESGPPDIAGVNDGAVVGPGSDTTLLVTRYGGTVCAHDTASR